MWPVLTQRYQARNDPDWSLPAEVGGANGLSELLKGETEFEHNIVVDLGETMQTRALFTLIQIKGLVKRGLVYTLTMRVSQ